MVDALAPDRSNQSFGEAVLPRRTWGDGLVTDAHGEQSVRDGSAIDAIPITDQVSRRLSPRDASVILRWQPRRGRAPPWSRTFEPGAACHSSRPMPRRRPTGSVARTASICCSSCRTRREAPAMLCCEPRSSAVLIGTSCHRAFAHTAPQGVSNAEALIAAG
jgi:hypothetical protein